MRILAKVYRPFAQVNEYLWEAGPMQYRFGPVNTNHMKWDGYTLDEVLAYIKDIKKWNVFLLEAEWKGTGFLPQGLEGSIPSEGAT